MKTILITGATGFLGTHLVDLLRREEPESRLRLMSRSASVPNGTSGIEAVAGDITNAEQVRRAVEGVDEIYHLAGAVERSPANSWKQYDVHVEGTRHICEAARRSGVKRIVLASSSGTVAVDREPVVRNEDTTDPEGLMVALKRNGFTNVHRTTKGKLLFSDEGGEMEWKAAVRGGVVKPGGRL